MVVCIRCLGVTQLQGAADSSDLNFMTLEVLLHHPGTVLCLGILLVLSNQSPPSCVYARAIPIVV